ncbi:DUF1289 domain-containing protein [Thalassotalea euphylliae]|uniref:DUF1289 domain-containing protein n=1 Tax=Thalassotalea euphylliae TaxID=1655234 RepID=UPI00362A0B13
MPSDVNPTGTEELASPCVRNCCLDRDDICLGCFRHIDEIVGWQSFSADKKRLILTNCADRAVKRREAAPFQSNE